MPQSGPAVFSRSQPGPIKPKERIEFIDLAKGVCILLVMQFHVAQETGVQDMESSFYILTKNMRMPLYFFLSGMFFKDYGGFFPTALKKFNKLMVPFIFFILLAYIVFYIPLWFSQGESLVPASLSSAYSWFIGMNMPLWFLFSLFLMNLLFFPLVAYVRNEWLRLAIVTALAASAPPIFNLLNSSIITSTLNCIPFFYLGWVCARRSDWLRRHVRKKHLILFSICSISLATFIIFLTGRLRFDPMAPNQTVAGILLYPSATLLVAALLAVCKAIVHLPLISWIGRYSIILLGTHMTFIQISKLLLGFIDGTAVWQRAIVFAIVLALCCVAIPLLRKYFPKFCAQKDLIPLPQKITPKTCIHE